MNLTLEFLLVDYLSFKSPVLGLGFILLFICNALSISVLYLSNENMLSEQFTVMSLLITIHLRALFIPEISNTNKAVYIIHFCGG